MDLEGMTPEEQLQDLMRQKEELLAEQKFKQLLAEKERLLKDEKILFYNRPPKVHLKQMEFHKDNHRIRCLFGGNRCIAGESLIYDPVEKQYREVQKIDSDFHVYSWDKNKNALVVAKALKPFHHDDIDELFDIGLSNGQRFTASLNHRVLDGCGVFRYICQNYIGGGLFQPQTIEEHDRLIHVSDVENWIQKPQDSQCDYHHIPCLYDERFPSVKADAEDVAPLQGHAQKPLSHEVYGHEDALCNKHKHSRVCHIGDLPSSLGDLLRCVGRSVLFLSHAFCKFLLHSDLHILSGHRPIYGCDFQPQSSNGFVEFAHRLNLKHCILTNKKPPIDSNVLFVISISYNRRDYKWDFTVPDYKNYYMSGIIHHNTGKSCAGAVEAVWYATGTHPYKKIEVPNDGWVVSLTNDVQRDVAQSEILRWLPKRLINQRGIRVRDGRKDDLEKAIIDILPLTNGSTISFKSEEQGRGKFQGTSRRWIWMDEELTDKGIYDECLMRLMDKRGDAWITMTPLLGLSWTYDTIYINEIKNPNIRYWTMSWEDNPYLSEEEVQEQIRDMPEEEREARQYGRFVAVSGLVYKEFREELHVIDPFEVPKGWYDNISIDPGLDAPLACNFYACDGDGTVYVIAEHYEAGRGIDYHAEKIWNIAKELKWPLGFNGKLHALIDSAANQKTLAAERSVTELFRDYKIICNTGVDKDVWTGIQRVKSYLKLRPHIDTDVWPRGKPKLFIFRTCVNLIKEMKSYRWKPPTDNNANPDAPVKKQDHSMDNLRYYIMSKPEIYIANKPQLTGEYHYQELKMKGYSDAEIDRLARNGVRVMGR